MPYILLQVASPIPAFEHSADNTVSDIDDGKLDHTPLPMETRKRSTVDKYNSTWNSQLIFWHVLLNYCIDIYYNL